MNLKYEGCKMKFDEGVKWGKLLNYLKNLQDETAFIRLSKWFSVRMDDVISGIPLARMYVDAYGSEEPEAEEVRRNFYVYLQRILFDGDTLGVATNPWSSLIPELGVDFGNRKAIRPTTYLRQRLDGASRMVHLYAVHIQCEFGRCKIKY